jgi:hypothetical protein
MPKVIKKPIPIRATEKEWAIIDEHAAEAGLSRSAYMLACADVSVNDQRLSGFDEWRLLYLLIDLANSQRYMLRPLPVEVHRKDKEEKESVDLTIREAVYGIYAMVDQLSASRKKSDGK